MHKKALEYVIYDGMNTEGQLYRVTKDYAVRFVRDISLVGMNVRFFINYPDPKETFNRSSYRELPLINPTISNLPLDCFDDYFELSNLPISGSFHFYFSKDGSHPPPPSLGLPDSRVAGSGYVIIDPHFSGKFTSSKLNESDSVKDWDLSGVVLHSCLSKNLGYFSEWETRLMASKEGTYNMIHFTPLQELGYSRSAYSLRDQLKLNPNFSLPGSKLVDWTDVDNFVKHLENNWSILSMTDLVFNHTANDSPWIHEHPECAYNVINSPHLAPAYLLDHIVWRLTLEASTGSLSVQGIPSRLENANSELPAMRHWLQKEISAAKLYEFFLTDVEATVKEFSTWLLSGKSSAMAPSFISNSPNLMLKIDGPRKGRRFGSTVDFKIARQEFVGIKEHGMPFSQAAAETASEQLKNRLIELNAQKKAEIEQHLNVAIENVLANANYRFYDPNGLKLKDVTVDTPIMWTYFYHPVPNLKTTVEAEQVLYGPSAVKIMAFNGWVMNDDPLRNFAEAESFVYLRRELIVWGDSIKLRYGKGPEDCPYLWDRMTKYTELTARIFHAVRLDNCHSTPLHVAQYMLDHGRAVRPNLYVVAELFTGAEYLDNVFINKLGINSLIRESLSAFDCPDLGRQIHRFGVNRPAGAFFERPGSHRLYPSMAHAVLFDQTHDNPSILDKHNIFNYLPIAAAISFASCAIGSTRGCDELVPHYVDVVKEERMYAKWPEQVNSGTGFVEPKSIFNELHSWLSSQGFTECFVDQVTPNVLAVTRFCPETREACIMVTHAAFDDPGPNPHHSDFRSIQVGGRVNRLLCEIRSSYQGSYPPQRDFKKNPEFINGLTGMHYSIVQNVPASESKMFRVESHINERNVTVDSLIFYNFPPGSVVVLSIRLVEIQQQAISDLHDFIRDQLDCRLHVARASQSVGKGEKAYAPLMLPGRKSSLRPNTVRAVLGNVNLLDLNKCLFRCAAEEIADGLGRNAYNIPGWGFLVYCGFESIFAELQHIRDRNDLGHPICCHLREGDWLANYLCERLEQIPKNSEGLLSGTLSELGRIIKMMYNPLSRIPRYLVPAYFEIITSSLCDLLHSETILRLAPWIRTSSTLVKRLALATTQFYGYIGNTRLPGRMITEVGSKSPTAKTISGPLHCSLSAGLPHFAEGMWRCWGRDTFIAIRGCLILTGRFEDAATLILSYAGLLRYGLIPNLTGDGYEISPRYNCRDSVWYWLYSIVCYEDAVRASKYSNASLTTESNPRSILDQPVWRWALTDSTIDWPKEHNTNRYGRASQRIQLLHEVMQEALQCHITGIEFIEDNAGPQLDEQMKPEGFKVEASIDLNTGFPRGGNQFNCGTWMDKMGSSTKAQNKGVPATPRDGSAVELVGLAYAVVSWLESAHQNENSQSAYYPHSGVQLKSGKFLTWKDWKGKVKASFEKEFWIPNDTTDPQLMYNRGIYRDSVGSSAGYTDNQLRPNFLVTMVTAPDLFIPEHAWDALEIVCKRLVGPLGIRTLSKDDLAYRGYYHNSNDSSDYTVARGFNYHQGPEWLWPTGYYMRARLKFARMLVKLNPDKWGNLVAKTTSECQQILSRLDKHLQSNSWRSLPELTNADGEECYDSSYAQAWSVGCVLEAAYDLIFQSH